MDYTDKSLYAHKSHFTSLNLERTASSPSNFSPQKKRKTNNSPAVSTICASFSFATDNKEQQAVTEEKRNTEIALDLCKFILKYGDEFARKKIKSFQEPLATSRLIKDSEGVRNVKALRNIGALRLSLPNAMEEIPTDVVKGLDLLKNLHELDISSNRLISLPETMKKLTKLTHLYINGNPLTEFPNFVSELPNLNSLAINATKIKKVPYSLKNIISSYSPGITWISAFYFYMVEEFILEKGAFFFEKILQLNSMVFA